MTLWVTGPPHTVLVSWVLHQAVHKPLPNLRTQPEGPGCLPAHFSSTLAWCCSCSCFSRMYLNCSCCILRHVALSRSSPEKHCRLARPHWGLLLPKRAGNSFQSLFESQRSNSCPFFSCCFCSQNSWSFLASRHVHSACSFSSIWATRSYCAWLVPRGGGQGHGEGPKGGIEPTQHGLYSQGPSG